MNEETLQTKGDVEKIKGKVNAILVGSHFMNSGNVEKDIIELIK